MLSEGWHKFLALVGLGPGNELGTPTPMYVFIASKKKEPTLSAEFKIMHTYKYFCKHILVCNSM